MKPFLIALGCLAPGIAACGFGAVCTEEPTSSASSPTIIDLALVDALEDNPFQLVFSLSFEDSDGDLYGGQAEYFVGSKLSGVQSMKDLFRQSAVAETATSGTLAVSLQFSNEEISSGTREVAFGMQILDDKEQRSRCFSLLLEFNVEYARVLKRGGCEVVSASPSWAWDSRKGVRGTGKTSFGLKDKIRVGQPGGHG